MSLRPSSPIQLSCQIARVDEAIGPVRWLAARCEALQERGLMWLNDRSGVSVWHSVGQSGCFLLQLEYPKWVGLVFAEDPAVSANEALTLPESSTRPVTSED
ncbi:hypothetical protein DV096_07100 [Bradymonadaceae bacterium TMQ3]|nr:hypothetical protein DV096_07100 [Bradymonadaceae bacterium TMQ3]